MKKSILQTTIKAPAKSLDVSVEGRQPIANTLSLAGLAAIYSLFPGS